MRFMNKLSRSSQIFIGCMVLFATLAFILPVNPQTLAIYHLTESEYRYLLFIILIPLIAAWSIAFYSFRRLREYARAIHDAPEGGDYATMAKGTGWLAWGFALPPLIGSLVGPFVISHPSLVNVLSWYNTYVYLIVTLVGLGYISSSIHKLARRSTINFEMRQIRYIVGLLVALSVTFCALIISRLHGTSLGDSFNSFYLPNVLVWITVVIPYLYAWCLGIIGAFELVIFAQQTSGVIYRQALRYLAAGLVIIIVSMIALQYFRAIVPRTGAVTINGALITVYGIYAANAVGNALLAFGVKRLKRIEDI